MKAKLIDAIDFDQVNLLLEGFNKSTGFVTAILDLDGNVLSKSGWRQICTDFHRLNPGTSKRCTQSDTELAGKMAQGEKYHFYKCLNGLVDVAVPLVINGEHIANLFSGQFFFEKPDKSFFIKQAKDFGFDEKSYLEALEKVPVIDKDKVKPVMDFLLDMTELISNITLQKLEQTELIKKLKESEEIKSELLLKLNDAQQIAKIGSWEWNLKTNQVWWSDETYRIFGVNPEEFTPDFEANGQFIHPDDIENYRKLFEYSLKTGEPLNYDFRLITRDGLLKHCNAKGKVIYDKSGQAEIFIGTVTDNTKRWQIEEERQKFLMLANSSSEFIGMCDLEFKPTYVNPAGVSMVGLPDMEAACRVMVQDYFFPEDQQFITEEFFPRVLLEGHGDVEIRLRHFQTGEPIWMFYYLFHVRDASGKVIGWATVSRDITERKKAEEALRESEQEFRSLAESMPQIVWATRADGWNIYFNQQWVDYTGLTLEESYGHGWNKPFHPDDQQRAWDAWNNAVNNNGIYSIEVRLRRYDGVYRWWLVRGVPLINDNGNILKWFGTCTDIEEIKTAEIEIKELNLELEKRVEERTIELEEKVIELNENQEALLNLVEDLNEKTVLIEKSSEQLDKVNKELQAFTYSVSHDLKAPLRGIDGYSKLLLELYSKNLNPEARTFIQNIREGTSQMNQLIEDLLSYSRLERVSLKNVQIDIKNIVNAVIEKFNKEISDRQIKIIVEVKPCSVLADFDGLSIAIRNLIENAIKFTHEAENPKINIQLKETKETCILLVKDNGIGFNMKFHNKIFEIFQRLHRAENYPGTGIGLALVYKAMQRMGGSVWAESKEGEGSIFYLEIPKTKIL